MEFEITAFDPRSIKENAFILIFARRRSGKSFAVQRLIYENRKNYDEVYLFSNTIDLQPKSEYGFIPDDHKYNKLDKEVIEDILETQQEQIQENLKKGGKKKKVDHILIILDDIISDSTFLRRNSIIDKLAVQGRHSNISVIVLTQNFTGQTGISPAMRKNSDYVMSFYQQNINDLKKLSEQYLSLVDTKTGIQLLKDVTNDAYKMLVIEVTKTQARQYKDFVTFYKAPEILPKFKIGKDEGVHRRCGAEGVLVNGTLSLDGRLIESSSSNTVNSGLNSERNFSERKIKRKPKQPLNVFTPSLFPLDIKIFDPNEK